MKRCPHCNREKRLDQFGDYKCHWGIAKKQSWCKACNNENGKQRYHLRKRREA